MPRKAAADLKSADKIVDEALADFRVVSEFKGELAKEAYDLQDAETRGVIDGILKTLQTHAKGTVTLELAEPHGTLASVPIEAETLAFNLLFLAMEIVKDLAVMGVQVKSFQFPAKFCAICGGDVSG